MTATDSTRGRAHRPGDAGHRRRRDQRPQGHAGDPGCRADRRPDPALLRPPAARARRRLPPVPGRGRDARPRRQPEDDDGPARTCEAAGVVHARGLRGHGGQHPGLLADRRQGAAGRDGAAAHQPPARLPGVRQGRRVPAAEPGDVQRPWRVTVHRVQAHLPQADQHLRAGAARPGALRALRPVHPLLRADRRRPVHRSHRARRVAAGGHLREGAVRVLLLGQHDPDLPGRRADLGVVPLPLAAVRPHLLAVGVRALRRRLRAAHRPPPRQGHPPAGGQRPRGQRGVELRQGPLRVRVRPAR